MTNNSNTNVSDKIKIDLHNKDNDHTIETKSSTISETNIEKKSSPVITEKNTEPIDTKQNVQEKNIKDKKQFKGTPPQVIHTNQKEGYRMAYSHQLPQYDPDVQRHQNMEDSGYKIENIKIHRVHKLQSQIPNLTLYKNEFKRVRVSGLDKLSTPHEVQYNRYIKDSEIVQIDNMRNIEENDNTVAQAFVQAGPREFIPWKEGEVRAAIITCGGQCPGQNNVIQELFCSLYYNYGVDVIYGIRAGFRGFWHQDFQPWLRLTPKLVKGIHEQGGSIQGTSRGGFDQNRIVNALEVYGINQVYIVGGDGTHRGALEIHEECLRRGLKVAVACIPKTIDNDVGIIDRSFGFNTSVAEARRAISSVVVEAQCTPNCIGIVKLMGRHAGYIAAHSALASRQVDIVLIPEVPFYMEGESGLLPYVYRLLKAQSSVVIVVAEGAGHEQLKTQESEIDESGNVKLKDIGQYLTQNITSYMKKKNFNISIKYVDPSYMVRSVPADAEDAVYCLYLASYAVHGAMAGYSGFSLGLVSGRSVQQPIEVICRASPSYLNPKGSTWEHILAMTHQPIWEDSMKKQISTKL